MSETNTAIAISPKYKQAAEQIDAIVKAANEDLLPATVGQAVGRAIGIASAIDGIRDILNKSDLMKPVMALQNTKLGFKTDRRDGYDLRTVTDCAIEALMNGLQLTGNHFNIISGGMYMTQEGTAHKLRTMKGLTGLKRKYGVPMAKNGGAIVECSATWKMHGVADSLECTIPVRVSEKQGVDAILGKAERKLNARILSQITGSEIADGEVDGADAVEVSFTDTSAGASLSRMADEDESTQADEGRDEE